MTITAAERRLDRAREALAHLHEVLELDFALELWDGSRVPAGAPADGLRIAIADEAAVPSLIRRPSFSTLIDLYVRGAIDIRGGTLFEFAARRPSLRGSEIRRRVDKGLLIRTLLPFAFTSSASTRPAFDDELDAGAGATRGRGSGQAEIEFHYDVSNDFYRLFLDPEMVYSCGYFTDWGNDIAQAQRDKLDMICRKLRLRPGETFLDVGSGWGALVCHAAEHYGVTAHGVTLSPEQLALSQQRIRDRGLSDRVTVELRDFRALGGRFDKIASIGMFEHVGLANHEAYFKAIRALLTERGLYLHHAITRRGRVSDRAFRHKRPEYAAMTRYIFPGAELDHIGMTARNLESHGFEVHDVEGWREHYARTTELWARRLMAERDAAVAEVGERRYRMWVLYLSGVSLAFQRGTLQIFQTLTSRRSRGASGLPPTRADLYR
jgi:cyclopropane-fatty-acyl-phospholipid synthase